jgi:glycosyltransferase involved in cell wall biosynthesis
VTGLPCVAWPQGAPNGEWDALRSLRPLVVQTAGPLAYRALWALYAVKQRQARRWARRADVLLCGSRWSIENWVRLGLPRAGCHALPYPIDLYHFHPDGPSAPVAGVTTFLWLGRIVPRKRLDLLLDAYEHLRRDRQDVRLLIVGPFSYARRLRALLDRFGPGDGVEYRPRVPRARVPELLRGVDVLVQPSENEDVGSSVLEALACGTLTIVGPSNGTRDYLSARSLVFNAYTPDSLRDAMARAITALQTDRAGIAAEARATAERLFSIDAVVARVESILLQTRADRTSAPHPLDYPGLIGHP